MFQSDERLKIIHEIYQVISAAELPEDIARIAINRIRGWVPCFGAGVFLVDSDSREITVLATEIHGQENLQPLSRFSLEDSPDLQRWLERLRRGEIFPVEDISTLSPVTLAFHTVQAAGFRSGINVPLLCQGQLIGILSLGWNRHGIIESEHGEIALEVAIPLAFAIQNARLVQLYKGQHDQLRDLKTRLVEMEEEERRRLARELHDQVGQNLTALNINLNIMRTQVPADCAAKIGDKFQECLDLVQKTVESIRNVMADLRPVLLDDYGLLSTLQWYGERFYKLTGIAVTVEGKEVQPRLPQIVETALFRITQEALNNVTKHARAGQVMITLDHEVPSSVRLTISDNGLGFDVTSLQYPKTGRGWGLITMRERAEGVGGLLKVDSKPGQGTNLMIEIKSESDKGIAD